MEDTKVIAVDPDAITYMETPAMEFENASTLAGVIVTNS